MTLVDVLLSLVDISLAALGRFLGDSILSWFGGLIF